MRLKDLFLGFCETKVQKKKAYCAVQDADKMMNGKLWTQNDRISETTGEKRASGLYLCMLMTYSLN